MFFLLFFIITVFSSCTIEPVAIVPITTEPDTTDPDTTLPEDSRIFEISTESWTEADLLFHRDENWMGGDGAFSIPLGENRVLWLFGDSFIATSDNHLRSESKLVRNSIAVQDGLNPESADITFFWDKSEVEPGSFFREINNTWFWPMHGMALDNGSLIIFLYRVISDANAFGFIVDGYKAIRIEDYTLSPENWIFTDLEVPENLFSICTGVSLLEKEDFIYSYAVQEPGNHRIFMARWDKADFSAGNLMQPQWWYGKDTGWIIGADIPTEPEVIFTEGATEFSVSEIPSGFIHIQSIVFGGKIAGRKSVEMTGSWSQPESIFTIPFPDIPQMFSYAGKGHPELEGADLVITYATNTMSLTQLINNTDVYYPKFVKLNFTE